MLNNICSVLHSLCNYMFLQKIYLFHKLSFVLDFNLVKLGRSFVHVLIAMKVYCHSKKSSKASLFSNTLCWYLELIRFLISCKGPTIKYIRKIFQKANISNTLIRTRTCMYQGVRNVSFSVNFAYLLNGWPLEINLYQPPFFSL